MSSFYPAIATLFDGDPEVLPSALGFPPEIPRVILKNKTATVRLEIAAARVSLFHLMKRHDEPNINLERFYSEAVGIFKMFMDMTDCNVGRLAAVRTVYAIHNEPGIFLARHFCKESWSSAPLDRPENFEIHAHKVFKLDTNLMVNSWARAKTGNLTAEDKQARIVLFEQDLNTLSEEADKRVLDRQEIDRFFGKIVIEFESILNQYFPATNGAKP
jgi:hypothetical protein